MRILHLAYEDPRKPGAGGGSVRTLELNRRLARTHEVTALVAGYKDAQARTEHGVRWVPIGTRTGSKLDLLSYFAALGPAILRHPHDLIVEDFGAPFSVGLAPLFSRRPLVASVQWLFAAEMRAKYHLPFDLVEKHGLPFYHRFIAVSAWLGRDLRARRPDSVIDVVPNGVPAEAFQTAARAPEHLIFVGRLDLLHKGGDLLLEVMHRLRTLLADRTPRLLIVGDGPDRSRMVQQAQTLGLEALVEFVGRAEGQAKFELMAGAHAVLMPSRYETFGMVAVEAQAAGVPLVTFDVGPLAEVTGGVATDLIAPFEVQAFAEAVAERVRHPEQRADLRLQGQRWARQYDWDLLAGQQEACYLSALGVRQGRAVLRSEP